MKYMNFDSDGAKFASTAFTELIILAVYYYVLKWIGYVGMLKSLYYLKRTNWEKAELHANESISGKWTIGLVRLCSLRLRACARSQRGQLLEALSDCEQVVAKQPRNWRALYLKGCLLHDLGRQPEALESLNRALERNPKNSHGWFVRGLCAGKLSLRSEGVNSFTQCAKLAPHFWEARRKRAELLAEMGRYQESLVDFSSLPTLPSCSPKMMLAQHLLACERFHEAAFWASRYVHDCDEPGGHILMALAYGAMEEHERALDCLNRALNHTISPFALWIRGFNHLFRGDAWGAVQDFEWAVAMAGSSFPQAQEALRQTRASAGLDVLPQFVSVSLN